MLDEYILCARCRALVHESLAVDGSGDLAGFVFCRKCASEIMDTECRECGGDGELDVCTPYSRTGEAYATVKCDACRGSGLV